MERGFIRPLPVICIVIMLVMSFVSCNGNKDIAEKSIKGIEAEEYKANFERLPLKLLSGEEIDAKWGDSDTGRGGSDSGRGGSDAGRGSGDTGRGPNSAGGPERPMSAIYVEDGKYLPKESETGVVSGGNIEDTSASGVKIIVKEGDAGGITVRGEGSQYTLSDSEIDISGSGKGGAGATCEDHGTLILKNVKITTNGSRKYTVSSTNSGTVKVYDSTLVSHDEPFEILPDSSITDNASRYLGIQGNSRTTMTISNSYSYFYNCSITADGWGALSTDKAVEFVYLEANDCRIKTVISGYGAYADFLCHDTFNNCDFDVASMAIVVAGCGDATFKDPKAKCGTFFALMHCVTGSYTEVGGLNVTGGEISSKSPAIVIRSHNADINLDSVKIVSESGILINTMINPDPNATTTEGKKVYGVHATLKDMDVEGDVIHEDPDRIMSLDFKSTALKGAIKNIYVSMDAASKWTATGDSEVIIVGSVEVAQIDAPEGVTINAVAGESGTYVLASGGSLILKES